MASVGVELVRNFQLLFEYFPSECCAKLINERMLIFPDQRIFQGVMMYVLDIMNTNWRSKLSGVLISKRDERLFYNILCDHLKILRKQFPEVSLPMMTPSTMICFCGEKSRENLLKITEALMLFIMKRENYQIEDNSNNEDVELKLQEISEECDSVKDQILRTTEKFERDTLRQKKIMQLVVSAGNWDEDTKDRLLDINDNTIISEMQEISKTSSKESSLLKQDLLPYFNHIRHEIKITECNCLPKYQLPTETISKISELVWEANKNLMKVHIKNVQLAAEINMINHSFMRQEHPDVELNDHVPTSLLQDLQALVEEDQSIPKYRYPFVVESPLVVNVHSPGQNTSLGLSPVVGNDWEEMNKSSVKCDAELVADLVAPVKISVSPGRPLIDHILGGSVKKPQPNDTIKSIAQRMCSKVTPSYEFKKKNKSFIDFPYFSLSSTTGQPSKNSMTSSKRDTELGVFTPLFKAQMFGAQSTSRRQSMGFVKPSNCFVRRQLNKPSPAIKRRSLSQSSMKIPKSTSKVDILASETTSKENEDKMINMIVKEMLTDVNAETSFSQSGNVHPLPHSPFLSCVRDLNSSHCEHSFQLQRKSKSQARNKFSDTFDSSLSGIECLSSAGGKNTMPSDQKSEFHSSFKADASFMSEILEDDNEIAAAINSFKEEFSATEPMCGKEQCDDFLSPKEMTEIYNSFQAQKEVDVKKKTGEDSIGVLIQKFNAIMAKKKMLS